MNVHQLEEARVKALSDVTGVPEDRIEKGWKNFFTANHDVYLVTTRKELEEEDIYELWREDKRQGYGMFVPDDEYMYDWCVEHYADQTYEDAQEALTAMYEDDIFTVIGGDSLRYDLEKMGYAEDDFVDDLTAAFVADGRIDPKEDCKENSEGKLEYNGDMDELIHDAAAENAEANIRSYSESDLVEIAYGGNPPWQEGDVVDDEDFQEDYFFEILTNEELMKETLNPEFVEEDGQEFIVIKVF